MVKNPINNGRIIILGGAGFCPSTVFPTMLDVFGLILCVTVSSHCSCRNFMTLVTEKAMLVTNAGKLDGQMLKNIGAVIVSAEAANMRLGVLVVLLGFEMFFFWGVEERISAGEMDMIFIETTASQTTLVDRPLIF